MSDSAPLRFAQPPVASLALTLVDESAGRLAVMGNADSWGWGRRHPLARQPLRLGGGRDRPPCLRSALDCSPAAPTSDHEPQICPLAAFPALAGAVAASRASLLLLFDAGLRLGVVVSIVPLKRG